MEVARGAVAGVAGAMAMSVVRSLTTRVGLVERTPPEAIGSEAVPGLLRSVPPRARPAALELAHWAYGGLGGIAFTTIPGRVRRLPGAGPVYGLASWLLYDGVVAPALGLSHARRPRPAERAALLADHLLYGTIVGRVTGGGAASPSP